MQNNLEEAYVDNEDSQAVLKAAIELKSQSKSIFKNLRKPEINVADLQTAWKENGFPDDTRDIEIILSAHGYSRREIRKIFSAIFGEDMSHNDETTENPAVRKIAEYAKAHGLVDELKTLLQNEFGDELGLNNTGIDRVRQFTKKFMIEDIRHIFTEIVKEPRYERERIIREQNLKALGRNKRQDVEVPESVDLHDVLKADQYIRLLHKLRANANAGINITRIKNRIIQSWKKGMKHRKHYDDLLQQINLSLPDLIK